MLGRGQRASKKRPEPSGFVVLSALAALSSGCASNQYMGISLKPGDGDPVAQALAAKAQSGDKQSQYELGRWFEDSTDPNGLKKAIKLYRIAATPRGGTRLLYTPGASGVTTSVVSAGLGVEPYAPARARLDQLLSTRQPARPKRNPLQSPDFEKEYYDVITARSGCPIEATQKFLNKYSDVIVVGKIVDDKQFHPRGDEDDLLYGEIYIEVDHMIKSSKNFKNMKFIHGYYAIKADRPCFQGAALDDNVFYFFHKNDILYLVIGRGAP